MIKRFARLCAPLVAAALILTSSISSYAADGTSYEYDAYIYDGWVNVLECPSAFEVEKVLTGKSLLGIQIKDFEDAATSKDGRIFLTDTQTGRVYVCDEEGNCLTAIKKLRGLDGTDEIDADGNPKTLTAPEGVWAHDQERELYIADPAAREIVVLDMDTYLVKKTITEPAGLSGSALFEPSKVAVDKANRIFVIVKGSYDGIIELDHEGKFIGYYGVNVPRVNLIDYFWKSIASDSQKEKMSKSFAPAFNNVTVDGEGFVMAVTYDSAASDSVFRLNAKGENVLREEGYTKVVGDMYRLSGREEKSQFVDIAVTDYGTYALLDKSDGRIFIYNYDGELMNAFAIKSNTADGFKIPTSIAWLGDKLVVTDSGYNCAYIFAPTDFGQAMLNASRYYYKGEWDDALVWFEEAVRLNSNYEIAYTGIGKNYLMKSMYKEAMYYFKLGNNREYYSKAYNGYRGEQIRDHFYIVVILVVGAIAALIYSEIVYHRKNRKKA